jgi:hypothetical protein
MSSAKAALESDTRVSLAFCFDKLRYYTHKYVGLWYFHAPNLATLLFGLYILGACF